MSTLTGHGSAKGEERWQLGRAPGLFDAVVTYRFGPRGLGLVGYPQFGAPSMTAAQVDAWPAGWFTAGNAPWSSPGYRSRRSG